MQTIATVQIYDVMDQVHISLQVRQQENDVSPWETVMLEVGTYPGTGESEPREWLRDSLVALIERV